MSAFTIGFRRGGIHLPRLGLWLDAHKAQAGPERVFVSHAHADHIGAHREVILSAATGRLMQARMGGEREEHILPFKEATSFAHGTAPFEVTLLPAGHILGSAMAWIEAGGESLLYTGDFKLRPSLSAELCEPRCADILIMETTFGRAQYQFPNTEEVMRGVIRFCREALDNEGTAILFAYSLGKSQEMLRGLVDAGLPIMLHGAVHKMTQVYEQFGQTFPPYEQFDADKATGRVLFCPPNIAGSGALRKLGRARTAVLTGWAVDPNCRFRSGTDAAFPLSDHADFPDLIEMVKQVAPKKVYTLHGFAADFAQTLRDLGFDARALSEDEQMRFGFRVEGCGLPAGNERRAGASGHPRPGGAAVPAAQTGVSPANMNTGEASGRAGETPAPLKWDGVATFESFARACVSIAGTSSKPDKTRLLAEYLQALDEDSVALVAAWFAGVPFAASEGMAPRLGWALLRDALCVVGGINAGEFHHIYLKHSDLGETAAEVLERRGVRIANLTLAEADLLFRQVGHARGSGAKLPSLRCALGACSPLEAKYLVRICTSGLRVGLEDGLVEEAIARAFNVKVEEVRQASLLLGDIGGTARLAKQNRLASASIMPLSQLKPVLAVPRERAADAWEQMPLSICFSAPNGRVAAVNAVE